MLYIEKGAPLQSVSLKTAEIKRTEEWKRLSLDAPENKEEKAEYTKALRNMFEMFSKDDIRKSLVAEQHGLCAYCMRRIEDHNSSMRIEHWYPLNENKNTAIEYKNFLGVCMGIDSEYSSEYSCCDRSKSGEIICIDPRDQRMMDLIKYESDGKMYVEGSSGWTKQQIEAFQNDIDNILKLNGINSEIRSRRKAVLKRCQKTLGRLQMKKKDTLPNIQALIDEIEGKENYPEYAGVILFYYKRWVSRHQR